MRSAIYVLVGLLATGLAAPRTARAEPTPAASQDHLPEQTAEAKMVSVVDGDTIKVKITQFGDPYEGQTKTVRLIGMDTPETKKPNSPIECYGAEATARTKKMLPVGRTVYLERDVSDVDRFNRLLRDVWFIGREDGRAYLADELLVREGYAVLSTFPPDVKYVDRLTEAQDAATAEQAGLWTSCGGADTPLGDTASVSPTQAPPELLVADCTPFASFDEAQAYYADHPEAQPIIDPNADGRACEVFFGVDQAAVDQAPADQGSANQEAGDQGIAAPPPAGQAPVEEASAPTTGCDPSYPDVCIPPYPPDLDCGQIGFRRFTVVPPDPHGFDGDGDGVGCESG